MTNAQEMHNQIMSELQENAMDVARMIKGLIIAHRHGDLAERAFSENCIKAAVEGVKQNPELAKLLIVEIFDGVRKLEYDYEAVVKDAATDGLHLPAWSDVEIKFA